jgi:hypothetical protein
VAFSLAETEIEAPDLMGKEQILMAFARAKRFWMAGVKKKMEQKGTVGAFTAQAKAAGMSTSAFARKSLVKGSRATTRTKRRAALAQRFAAARG